MHILARKFAMPRTASPARRSRAATPVTTRRRGRPPNGPEAQQAIRQRLLDAARTVFTRVGYHGLSVELVIAEAGLSRPTFYKYFRNTDEPIDLVVQDVNDRLIASLLASAAGHHDPVKVVDACLYAWRQWGEDLGPMLRPLFAELHDPHSPASRHRRRTLDILSSLFVRVAQLLDRPAPSPLLIDTLLNGVEYLGYRFQMETRRDQESWQKTHGAMLRLTLAMLGNASDFKNAIRIARSVGVDLNR
jgi:TetR/AcrR family transcriptional regulator